MLAWTDKSVDRSIWQGWLAAIRRLSATGSKYSEKGDDGKLCCIPGRLWVLNELHTYINTTLICSRFFHGTRNFCFTGPATSCSNLPSGSPCGCCLLEASRERKRRLPCQKRHENFSNKVDLHFFNVALFVII